MKLSSMASVLRKYGLTVVETPGWSNRGFLGRDLTEVRGVVWHHTATNRARFQHSDAPTLQMCIDGRPDVAGPLCNIVFGRNGTVYLTAAGLANHAGAGAFGNIPRDLGNYYTIGIEMESSGIAPWDWTPAQIRVAPYLGAALELGYLQHLAPEWRTQISHQEYSSQGKIDPAGWPGGMNGLRSQINAKIAELSGKKPAPAPAKPAPAKPKPKPAPAKPAKTAYVPDPHWVMERGETLSQVAAHFKTSVAKIAHYNGIANPNVVPIGMVIWPPNGKGVWIVDPGDTLGKIAAYYKTTVDRICNANGINNPNQIRVGQRLQIR